MKREIKTSTGLIMIFASVVLFFGSALTYWYYNDPNNYGGSTDTSSVTIKTSEDETTGWNAYTSADYGFSFKYPKEWVSSSNDEETIFSSNGQDAKILAGKAQGDLSNNSVVLSVTKERKSRYSGDSEALNSLEGRKVSTFAFNNVKLGSTNAVKATRTIKKGGELIEQPGTAGVDVEEIVINVVNDSNLIRFWFTNSGNNNNDKTINTLIQTIQLTSLTADWKTYTNNTYGFSFKYPNDWDVKKVVTTTREVFDNEDTIYKISLSDQTSARKIACANNEFQNWKDDSPTKAECEPILSQMSSEEKSKWTGPLAPLGIFLRVSNFDSSQSLSQWLVNEYRKGELDSYDVGKEITMGSLKGYISSAGCCAGYDLSYVVQKESHVYELGTNNRLASINDQNIKTRDDTFVNQVSDTFHFTK